MEKLPFTLNIGEAPLTVEQQKRFIQLIYDNQEVFSLCDRDLGFCEKIKHSIPTTTEKPVYLPHRQIPIQLQSEVRKCLEADLRPALFDHRKVLTLLKWSLFVRKQEKSVFALILGN